MLFGPVKSPESQSPKQKLEYRPQTHEGGLATGTRPTERAYILHHTNNTPDVNDDYVVQH